MTMHDSSGTSPLSDDVARLARLEGVVERLAHSIESVAEERRRDREDAERRHTALLHRIDAVSRDRQITMPIVLMFASVLIAVIGIGAGFVNMRVNPLEKDFHGHEQIAGHPEAMIRHAQADAERHSLQDQVSRLEEELDNTKASLTDTRERVGKLEVEAYHNGIDTQENRELLRDDYLRGDDKP